MTHEVVARRMAEREALITLARDYVAALTATVSVRAAYMAGSVARGDFNVWSDIDVVVVADSLPARVPDRTTLLTRDAPPRIQPIGFTPEEFGRARKRRNPLVLEALAFGVRLDRRTRVVLRRRTGPARGAPDR
jgi:predicted nucleotidyltransferase